MMAVGVTDWESARTSVEAGVRHLFFGTGSDFSILNGQGDPARSIQELERIAGEPITVSVDEEGGLVQRLAHITGVLPSAREMAATMSPQQVQNMMFDHGRKLAAMGITVDFAPVLDLGGAAEVSDNAIGSRAFSPDPQVVADFGRAYAQGLKDAGVQPVFKHFPGHGHASGDSHLGAVTAPPLEAMQQSDLVPFGQNAGFDGGGMMVGHVEVPGLGDAAPASINAAAYELLKKGGYGAGAPAFQGPVYTDDLTGMAAVSNRFPGPEAAVAAIVAGADQTLLAAGAIDVPGTVQHIAAAVDDGRITPERVTDAVHRTCVNSR